MLTQIPPLHGTPLQQSLSKLQIWPYSEHAVGVPTPPVPPLLEPALEAPPLLEPALPEPPLPALPVGGGLDVVQVPTVEPGSR